MVTKVEVELKTDDDVVEADVDESEVDMVVEDENEVVVLVLESTDASVNMRKSRRGRETNLSRWCSTS